MNVRRDSAMPIGLARRFKSGWWLFLLVACSLGVLESRADDDVPSSSTSKPQTKILGNPWPSAIILEPPANRDQLIQKLSRPDLLIWDGEGFERWLRERLETPATHKVDAGVVSSVLVAVHPVEVKGQLLVRYRIALDSDDRALIPIGLDGLVLGRVTESGRDLAVSIVGESRGWAVELAGRGEHQVEVETMAPVRSTVAGKNLELTISPTASTRVELVTSRPLIGARTGISEPLVIGAHEGGSRAEGHLSPRSKLELTWQEQATPQETLPPVLAARGELVINAGLDAMETRETWSIASLRGTAREVVFRLDRSETVVDLEVDRRPVAVNRLNADLAGFDDLVVPLPESMSAAVGSQTSTILFVSRKPRPPDQSGPSARFSVRGHPIVGARSQTGVIGIARSDIIDITPVEGRGVRRIDEKSDLLQAIRGRSEGWLGFEFSQQPYELGLEVEGVTPRFEVNARSTIIFRGAQAEVETRLLGRVWQGRLFDLKIEVPPGLTPQQSEVGPDEPTIRSTSKWSPPGNRGSSLNGGGEALLATFPRPLGPGDSFAITLRGTCLVPDEGEVVLGLFSPQGPAIASTEVAIVSGPGRRVDSGKESPGFARLEPSTPPPLWNWPKSWATIPGSVPTWLRSEHPEARLSIRIEACPTAIYHRSSLTVAIDRQGAAVVDEVVGDVANGPVATLDVALPPEVTDRWVAESGEGLEREPLGVDPATGWRRYRLKLSEPTNSFQVRMSYRLPFAIGLDNPDTGSLRFRVQPIRILEGTSTARMVRLTSESDVTLAAEAPGWTALAGGPRDSSDSTQQVRRSFEHVGGSAARAIEVSVTLGKLAQLPSLVASRLWLRSSQLPAGQLATTAQYRLEVHPRSILIRLPKGSRWVRGMAGTSELAGSEVEQMDADTYRITLPETSRAGPVALRIDSILDDPPSDGSWPAPELVESVVQQSAWELSLLGTRAGVGVPEGWTDENLWYREGFLWKRRPRRIEADLARWLAAEAQPRIAETAASRPGTTPVIPPASAEGDDWSGDFASGRHSYLFSRPGPPVPLNFATYARPTLLLVCSGPVLVLGLLILARRPPPRGVAGGMLVLGFLFVTTVEPNTALLVAESSSVGFALAAIAALIHGSLERRGRSTAVDPPVSALALVALPPPSTATPSVSPTTTPSTEKTVIRPKPESLGGSTSEFPAFPPKDRRVDPDQLPSSGVDLA